MATLGHMFPMDMGVMLVVPMLVVGALQWFGFFLVRHLSERKAMGPHQILE